MQINNNNNNSSNRWSSDVAQYSSSTVPRQAISTNGIGVMVQKGTTQGTAQGTVQAASTHLDVRDKDHLACSITLRKCKEHATGIRCAGETASASSLCSFEVSGLECPAHAPAIVGVVHGKHVRGRVTTLCETTRMLRVHVSDDLRLVGGWVGGRAGGCPMTNMSVRWPLMQQSLVGVQHAGGNARCAKGRAHIVRYALRIVGAKQRAVVPAHTVTMTASRTSRSWCGGCQILSRITEALRTVKHSTCNQPCTQMQPPPLPLSSGMLMEH